MLAILTETTCGIMCWEAREEVCRCSCGGINHGVLLKKNGTQPEKQCKIAGYRYKLHSIDPNSRVLYKIAYDINLSVGWAAIRVESESFRYHYSWKDSDKGAPARIKRATEAQCKNWDELKQVGEVMHAWERPYLLWVRVEMPETKLCQDECKRCQQMALDMWASEVEL